MQNKCSIYVSSSELFTVCPCTGQLPHFKVYRAMPSAATHRMTAASTMYTMVHLPTPMGEEEGGARGRGCGVSVSRMRADVG